MDEKKIEEILEQIWMQREDGNLSFEGLLTSKEEKIKKEDLDQMQTLGLLSQEEGSIILTERGENLASQIIRGHRLSERLMADVLDLGLKTIESRACTFEHIINHEIADAICTLLGHPKECPHGRSIPPGECCKKAKLEMESIVLPLSQLPVGAKAKIAYLVTKHYPRLDKLASLGVLPGVQITLHQTRPSYIIQIGHTQIALDEDILKDIYVRRLDKR